jgi:hypothetical protein
VLFDLKGELVRHEAKLGHFPYDAATLAGRHVLAGGRAPVDCATKPELLERSLSVRRIVGAHEKGPEPQANVIDCHLQLFEAPLVEPPGWQ